MRFPPSFIDEIKARLPVSQVVGKRVRLQKAGREWKGLSPFNKEKSPSFFVNDQKQAWFDFSSGKNGNIFTFLMETEGVSFPEAVERLAGEAGLPMPVMTQDDEVREQRRASLHEVMELATRYFEKTLTGSDGGKARRYLDGRSLSVETRSAFRIGYATAERFALRDHLAGEGIDRDLMIEAGLLIHGDDIAVPYDRFRDRVMFPICDSRGRVVAFGGRALQADVPAKYLNSPETPLFHKGRLLYNHHNARRAAHDAGSVVVVEGYIDVIAISAAGLRHAVAPLGTALGEDQLALLWQMAGEPVLCFDGDKAGRRAAYRAIDIALPLIAAGRSLRFALLPEGQDPDDLARQGGKPALDAVLAAARPLVDLLWQREVEAGPLDTPEQRAALEARLREQLRRISDETLRKHYRQAMDERIAALFGQTTGIARGPRQRGDFAGNQGRWRRDGVGRGEPPPPLRASSGLVASPLFARQRAASPREALIACVLIHHPALVSAHLELAEVLEFESPDAATVMAAVLDAAAHSRDVVVLDERLSIVRQSEPASRLIASVRAAERSILDSQAEPGAVTDTLRQAIALHRRARTLHNELRLAELALADGGDETTLAWLRDVQAQLQTLDGIEADTGEGSRKGEDRDL